MKSIALLIMLIFSVLASGQTISHFVNADSKWYVSRSYADADIEHPNFITTKTTIIGIQGDSIINSIQWLKIYATQDSLFQSNLKYKGLIRSENGYIFHIDTLHQLDTLYNFNLSIGDSVLFNFYGTPLSPQWLAITTIDSLLLNGTYYNRYHFEEPSGPNAFQQFNEQWIEGIGSIHGPLFTKHPRRFSEEIPDSKLLTCSYSNNNWIFHRNEASNKCFLWKVLNLQTHQNKYFTVFPNPFQENITLIYPKQFPSQLFVINTLGKTVYQCKIDQNTIKLHLSWLESGIYFLKWKNKIGTTTFKLIKK